MIQKLQMSTLITNTKKMLVNMHKPIYESHDSISTQNINPKWVYSNPCLHFAHPITSYHIWRERRKKERKKKEEFTYTVKWNESE